MKVKADNDEIFYRIVSVAVSASIIFFILAALKECSADGEAAKAPVPGTVEL